MNRDCTGFFVHRTIKLVEESLSNQTISGKHAIKLLSKDPLLGNGWEINGNTAAASQHVCTREKFYITTMEA
jgi:hypothetical protein